jgi:acyl dehydratase
MCRRSIRYRRRVLADLTTPLDLEGAGLGPVAVAVTADRIAFYADASGDHRERWTTRAPPGFASVLLFAVADLFLYHEKVVPFTATLLHLDQSFTYHAPMRAGSTITMEGTITRVRERSGSYFVTFESVGRDDHGDVVSATSTFVLSDRAAPRAEVIRTEPAARERSPASTDQRSASRHDLVRYAAATRDFNPLHWDHDVAVAAGLSGTVVHGLLMYAWMMQSAMAATDGRDVLAAKVRFRAALHPAETASLDAVVEGERVRLELTRDGAALVTGTATVAAEE